MTPLLPQAPSDGSGTNLADRMTSPLFLMGIGLLTGGLQGRGPAGFAAGANAAASMQSARAQQARLSFERAKLEQAQRQQAALTSLLGPQSASAVPGGVSWGAPTGLPQEGQTPGTGAPVASQDPLAQIDAQMARIRGNPAILASKVGRDTLAALAQQREALEPQLPPTSFREHQLAALDPAYKAHLLEQRRASAANIKVGQPALYWSQPKTFERADGSIINVTQNPDGTTTTQIIQGPQGKDPETKAAFAAWKTATALEKPLTELATQAVADRLPLTPGTPGAGRARTLYGQTLLQLKNYYELGVLSAQDVELVEGVVGTPPAAWGSLAQSILSGGRSDLMRKEQLTTMSKALTNSRKQAEAQLDASFPDWRKTWGAGRVQRGASTPPPPPSKGLPPGAAPPIEMQ